VQGVVAAPAAEFVQFNPGWVVAAAFFRRVIPFPAIGAFEGHNNPHAFFLRHGYLLVEDFGDDTRTDGQPAFANGKL
jgi:hypothetical protein